MANTIAFAKCSNSALVNVVPFLVTSTSGKPNVANILRIFSLVSSEVAELVMWMSIHFVQIWTKIRNILPKRGPE